MTLLTTYFLVGCTVLIFFRKKIKTRGYERFVVLFIFFILQNNELFSQSYIDLLNVNYKISPANKYDVASDALNEVSVENISGSLTLPLKRKNEDVILLGALANQLSMYASGNDPDNHRSYYTGLKLGYQKKLRDSLNVLLMLIPRITSDFEEIDKSDYQWGGVVLFNKVKNESFKWKIWTVRKY